MSTRLIKALVFKGTDYSEDYFEYIKLSQFTWVQFANTTDGNILYYMCLNDSLIYNTLAQHILNKYINGTILCIKLSKSAILDINVTDIPFLVDNLLSGYFNSINLVDESSNILDKNKTTNVNTIKYIDTNMLESYADADESSNDMLEPYDDTEESSNDMLDDYTNYAYYDYHTVYNS